MSFIDRAKRAVRDDLARGRGERELLAQQRQAEIDARGEQEASLDVAGTVRRMIAQGWRVESQIDGQVVMVTGHRPNHVLHLLLSIVTVGLWLIVWLIVGLTGGERRKIVRAGPDGRAVVVDV